MDDTICAIATAPGGSISVVRMSGAGAAGVLRAVFPVQDIADRRVYYGHIRHKGIADEVICWVMLAPRSYTREDLVEISCHGGYVSADRVLRALLENGARLAEPGEFTKRAFLNGRIDLSQAEAVADIIGAKTELAQSMALSQLRGFGSERVKAVRDGLGRVFAGIAASVDYPEDEIPGSGDAEICEGVKRCIAELDNCLRSADTGLLIKNGISAAIIGKPNAGKSSLLNALLGRGRAIVSDVPGTTRDVVSEDADIGGLLLRLSDTAGLRDSGDKIERLGIDKSMEEAAEASLVIKLFDLSAEFDSDDRRVLDLPCNKAIIVLNKSDLPVKMDTAHFDGHNSVCVSALCGEGIPELKEAVKKLVYGGDIDETPRYFANERHKAALVSARASLLRAVETLESGLSADFASIDLEDAYRELGSITGETAGEDIIARIFADFCLGK